VTALIRGEMIKVRTTRTALGFAIATLLLVLAQVLLTILTSDQIGRGDKRDAIAIGGTVGLLLLVFGIVGATGEYRHRTIAPAVLIAPDRVRLAGARIVAYVATALAVAFAALALALVLGVPLLGGEPGPELEGSDYGRVIAGGIVAAVLSAALGAGVGLLVRNQVAGVVGALVWLFVLEPLSGLIPGDIVDYTVGSATSSASGMDTPEGLGMGAGIAVLAAWTVLLVGAGMLVDRRRDVD
jgi:ABC-2 type transport system permease protein